MALALLLSAPAPATGDEVRPTLALPPDSPRWELVGQAKAVEYLGRKSLLLDGGAAVLKDLELGDCVIDVDVTSGSSRFSTTYRTTLRPAAPRS